jgi:hypothetical protein
MVLVAACRSLRLVHRVVVFALQMRRRMSQTHIESINDVLLGSVCGGTVAATDLPKNLLDMNSFQQTEEAMRRGGQQCLAAVNAAQQLSIFAAGEVERRGGPYLVTAIGAGKYLGADALVNHPACASRAR